MHIGELLEYLRKHEGQLIDITDPVQKMSTCIIMQILFGKNYEFADEEISTILKLSEIWMKVFFDEGVFLFLIINMLPDCFIKLFFRGKLATMKQKTKNFHKYIENKVQEHLDALDPDSTEDPRTFIDTILKEKINDSSFSVAGLAGTAMLMIPDSSLSISLHINWSLLFLAQRPALQKKLQDQIGAVCGNRPVRLADRTNLPLVAAFLLETYR